MTPPFYTIGHSNRSLVDFLGLLQQAGVAAIADVRRFPRSRSNPQFSDKALVAALDAAHVGYRHFPDLGGRRGRKPTGPSPNLLWINSSFRNYADYAQTEPFRQALEALRKFGRARTTAIMCAEAVWWRCHRRIIADYLLAEGERVLHILGPATPKPAQLTPGAHCADGMVLYPAPGNDVEIETENATQKRLDHQSPRRLLRP